MEELKIGKITTEELASWFYTTKKNLSKHKKDFLKILKECCEFESVYGGIIVNKIYKSTYIKNGANQEQKKEARKVNAGMFFAKRIKMGFLFILLLNRNKS